MALPKTDTFTASNQDLSTYNASWADFYTSHHEKIVSNHVESDNTSSDCASYWTGDTFTADQQISGVVGSANYSGLMVRVSGTEGGANGQGYLWLPSLGQAYWMSTTGSFTSIASGWTTTTGGETCIFRVVGNTLTGFINGSQAGTVDDTRYPTGGSPGIYMSGANAATMDTVSLDNYPATAATDPRTDGLIVFRAA